MAKSVFVYRVENESGMGPYAGPDPEWDLWDFNGPEHPVAWEDEKILAHFGGSDIDVRRALDIYKYNFGFANMKQFNKWFHKDDWLSALGKAGYVLNKYKTSSGDVIRGTAQALFTKSHAVLVQSNIIDFVSVTSD